MSPAQPSSANAKKLGDFIWNIADVSLRSVYKPHQYGSVFLPMAILRRMDCVLAPVKAAMLTEAKKYTTKMDHFDIVARKKFGVNFYNTSPWDFATLLGDPDGLKDNLVDYVNRFSPNVADIFERYSFENQLAKLDEKGRLLITVQKFAEVDLHPDKVSNADMGAMFEELIRKFAAASNETAGEHFTPRDAIRVIVDILFAADDDALSKPGIVRSVYDPTVGTGGMLSIAEEHLAAINPDARLTLYGQEVNDESYAICKSDLIGKGQNANNIQLADTLRDDKFAGKTFDYCMSNPPYGDDWEAAQADVRAEAAKFGEQGRFGHGLPGKGDGQMLFLCHLVSKLRPNKEGGGRAGIVLNGSPLFNGNAKSGESSIRQWLFESDLVDAIVALPTDMFYNTGIATYIWVLDNNKAAERRGKVQLINATASWSKAPKSLGNKRREMSDDDRAEVVKLYEGFEDSDFEHSRVVSTTFFGYRTVTVERPLRLNFAATDARMAKVFEQKEVVKLTAAEKDKLREVLIAIGDALHRNRAEFDGLLSKALGDNGLTLRAPVRKALLSALSERDQTADICTNSKGKTEPDASLRDFENVPLSEDVEDYFAREVSPHVPDAWVDQASTVTGYEIPFSRIFYQHLPPRLLSEIDDDLNTLASEIMEVLQDVER